MDNWNSRSYKYSPTGAPEVTNSLVTNRLATGVQKLQTNAVSSPIGALEGTSSPTDMFENQLVLLKLYKQSFTQYLFSAVELFV